MKHNKLEIFVTVITGSNPCLFEKWVDKTRIDLCTDYKVSGQDIDQCLIEKHGEIFSPEPEDPGRGKIPKALQEIADASPNIIIASVS